MPDKNATAAPDAPVEMKEGEFNPFVNSLLAVAKRLADESDALHKKIGANRESLRAMRTQGLMNAEQASAVEEFYPTRTRKPKDAANGATPAPAKS